MSELREQTALDLQPPADPVGSALSLLRRNPLGYKEVTEGWLRKNQSVWRAFYQATERLRLAGRRYGAKCIYEHLRYETAVRDAEITFKLDNTVVSGLARLYNDVIGEPYFETRQSQP